MIRMEGKNVSLPKSFRLTLKLLLNYWVYISIFLVIVLTITAVIGVNLLEYYGGGTVYE